MLEGQLSNKYLGLRITVISRITFGNSSSFNCKFTAAMIHWARQIKEVLNTQDAFEMAETSGPLDEIEFWKNRCQDLSGISMQLDKPGVKKIEQILETAKSSYVAPFRKLASQIKVCVDMFSKNVFGFQFSIVKSEYGLISSTNFKNINTSC